MNKNQTIIIIIAMVLIFGGIIGWGLVQKSNISKKGTGQEQTETEEVLSLSAIVSSVDTANNFLMVIPAGQESDVKVILSETTKLIKLEFPFDPKNPPTGGTFTPTQTEIKISGFKQGDNVFIKVKKDIAGKTEFDSVDFIQILP